MAEKSILEQALLQVQTLEEAVKQNAKGILASTMKEELNQLLKESKEEEEEEVQADESMEATEMDATEEEETKESKPEEEEEKDMSEQPDSDESDDEGSDEDEEDLDNDEEGLDKNIESMDSDDEMGDEELPMDSDEMGKDMEDEMGDENLPMDSDMEDDSLDMTGASDEEVLKVFKALGPEDGVVVKKEGGNLEVNTGDEEFIIKLNEEEEANEEVSEEESTEEEWKESEEEVEETIYEIELDETEEEEEESTHKEEATEARQGALKGLGSAKKVEPKESNLPGLGKPKKMEPKEGNLPGLGKPKKMEPKESDKVEATEAARTKSNPHGDKGGMNRAGLKSKKVFKAGSGVFNEEVETLKKQNTEYKKALVLFKEKLNEVAVFNANLAYATRLFTEHSTTKKEKLDILKRFDTVSNLNESKTLYTTIKSELDSKKPVTESVVEKISSTPTTSSSEVLSESRVYENPQFRRMKDLMGKIK